MSSHSYLSLPGAHRDLLWLLSIPYFFFSSRCSAACFTPNGTNINKYNNYADDAIYAPCNDTASASMCCATGPVRRGSEDECFLDGSGLCTNSNVGQDVHFWRESCTDPTWRDPACVKLFTNGTGDDSWGDRELKQCGDRTYCDLSNGQETATACCDAGQGVQVNVVNGLVIIESPSSTPTAMASTASSSPTVRASTSASSDGATMSGSSSTPQSSQSSGNSGLSTGAKAGIGAGIGVVALAFLALLAWYILAKRKGKGGKQAPPDYLTTGNRPKEVPPSEMYVQPAEMEQPGVGPTGQYYQYKKLTPELAGDGP